MVTRLAYLVGLVVAGNDTPASPEPGSSDAFGSMPEAERSEMYFSSPSELTQLLWASSAPAVISNNTLDAAKLRVLLGAIQAISDKYGLGETQQGRGSMQIGISTGGGMATRLSGSLVRYAMGQTNYGALIASNLQVLQMMMERNGSEVAAFPGLTPGAYQVTTLAAVSADTASPGLAAALVGCLLKPEVQGLNYGEGLPVTKAGMAAQFKAVNDALAEREQDPFTLDVDALASGMKSPVCVDTVLTEMMWTTVQSLCAGGMTLEEAASAIERDVKNYLAERS
jgi:hypothetical protein